jgi:D-ribose pyranose/furanose isomerase RbsD
VDRSVAGIERAFRIEARESGNLKEDVDKVVESVEDTYFVSHVEVLLPGPADDDNVDLDLRPVVVDFAGGIAIANSPVQIGSLVRVATNIMGKEQLDDKLAKPQVEEIESADG